MIDHKEIAANTTPKYKLEQLKWFYQHGRIPLKVLAKVVDLTVSTVYKTYKTTGIKRGEQSFDVDIATEKANNLSKIGFITEDHADMLIACVNIKKLRKGL